MNVQLNMPESGQFVAVWFNGDTPWSSTILIEDGRFHVYDWEEDEWVEDDKNFYLAKSCKYIV